VFGGNVSGQNLEVHCMSDNEMMMYCGMFGCTIKSLSESMGENITCKISITKYDNLHNTLNKKMTTGNYVGILKEFIPMIKDSIHLNVLLQLLTLKIIIAPRSKKLFSLLIVLFPTMECIQTKN